MQGQRIPTDTARVEAPEITPGRGVRHDPSQLAAVIETRPTETQATEAHWWVECADPFGRCRAMNVVVHQGQVVVVAPPGESAVLSARQTRLLGTALEKAAATAPHDSRRPPGRVPE